MKIIKELIDIIWNFIKKIILIIVNFLKLIIIVFHKNETQDVEKKSSLVKDIFIAFVLAMIVRSFLYEPFHIPSGSMKPTLLEGDFIFVSKYDFGYSRYSFPLGLPLFKGRIFSKKQPDRGDILVFRLPANPKINYIKRLIGLPGDTVQMKDGVLYINEKPVPKEYIGEILEYEKNPGSVIEEYKETLDNKVTFSVLDKTKFGNGDNTYPFNIPDKYYFFMGDNRDNSLDSRFKETGFIPEENLIGKARVIFFSANDNILKFWNWGSSIRVKRIFQKIN